VNVYLNLLDNTIGKQHAELAQALPAAVNGGSAMSHTTRLQKEEACETLDLGLRGLARSDQGHEPISKHSRARHRHALARTPEVHPPAVPERAQIRRLQLNDRSAELTWPPTLILKADQLTSSSESRLDALVVGASEDLLACPPAHIDRLNRSAAIRRTAYLSLPTR
jgi:hypothetical protein